MREVALLFLKLGVTAFGGPAAHVAMMQDEVVRRRGWLSNEDFLDLLGATNLIPGPNSTERAIHIGHRREGWPGLVVAGVCFIVPAALIVAALAWMYVSYGSRPQFSGVLYGVKPVIIAIVLQALHALSRTALKSRSLALLALVCGIAAFYGVHELIVLFVAGAVSGTGRAASLTAVAVPALLLQSGAAALAAKPFGIAAMFGFFVKVGAVLFGSGYVLLAFLQADLVHRWRWLTETQLLDAIAIGQVTPGPVFTTATFIGYLLAGGTGAFVATVGIFLPAFVFVAMSGPFVPRLRQSASAGAFLDGVNVASLSLMALVTWQLGVSAVTDALTLSIAFLSATILYRYRVNSAWLIAAGGLLGLVATSGW